MNEDDMCQAGDTVPGHDGIASGDALQSDSGGEADQITGFQIILDDKRHVWVGRQDDVFYVRTQNDAFHLRFKISMEGAIALHTLLGDALTDCRGLISEWRIHVESAKATSAQSPIDW